MEKLPAVKGCEGLIFYNFMGRITIVIGIHLIFYAFITT